MATLTVAFEGLMMFHAARGKHYVVIVDGRDHHHRAPKIGIYSSGRRDRAHPLAKGDAVSFGVAGAVTTSDLFDQHVPSLRTFIRRGRIRDDILQASSADGVLATIELPPGGLTTWSTLDEEVEMETANGTTREICFARFSVLQTGIELPTDVTIQRVGQPEPSSHSIDPAEIVVVSNASQHTDSRHFPLYERFLTHDAQLGRVVQGTLGGCDRGRGVGKLGEPAETILSEIDIGFTPNGDCGQVTDP